MSKEKKPELKRPKINSYWIYYCNFCNVYGTQYFWRGNLSDPISTSQVEFQSYLKNGDVEKVEIINRKLARVYLTEEARSNSIHANKFKDRIIKPGPNDAAYQFEFGDLQNFENSLNTIKTENGLNTKVVWNTETNSLGCSFYPQYLFFALISWGLVVYYAPYVGWRRRRCWRSVF